MRLWLRESLVGLLIAVPVMAALLLGVQRYRELKSENLKLRALQTAHPVSLVESARPHLPAPTALAAERHSSSEKLVEFLKKELEASQKVLADLEKHHQAASDAEKQRMAELLAEISRLNSELESLREERDRWRRAAERP